MVTHVSIDEARDRLRELLAAAAAGDTIVIDEGPERQFQLVPVPVAVPTKRLEYGSMRGQISMADDFDAPLDDFKDYM